MTDTAISILVAALVLAGIGIGRAANRARRRGNLRLASRLRLIQPALFFACGALNASYLWQHSGQRLVGVVVSGAFAAVWAVSEWRTSHAARPPVSEERR